MSNYLEAYPVTIHAEYPEQSSRLLALCGVLFMWPKAVLILPHMFVLYFVSLAAGFVAYICFWAVLFTGRYPRGMFDFVTGMLRWQTRVSAWLLGLVDRYPPFSTR